MYNARAGLVCTKEEIIEKWKSIPNAEVEFLDY